MFQQSMFPVEITHEEQYAGGTAHLRLTGVARNGERYAIKTVGDHPILPITEWFCYELCRYIGIPAPGCAVVQRPNGELAFGSRMDADVSEMGGKEISPAQTWLLLKEMRADLSAIYAADWFLPNPDRHVGNILYRQTQSGTKIPLAFDWSCVTSLAESPAFSQWPWRSGCNSDLVCKVMKQSFLWREDRERETLAKIASVPPSVVRAILESAPDPWRPTPALVGAIVSWWQGNAPLRARNRVS